jgi:two-component system, NarL family, invasion response regulator UvrY
MKYLIVDDHPLIRQSYSQIINQIHGGECTISQADMASKAWALWTTYRPDAVILDINLPDMSGLDLAARIIKRAPESKIMFFSMHHELGVVKKAINTGACSYVSKSAEPEEFAKAIVAMSQGRHYVEHRLANELLCMKSQSHQSPQMSLSPRENEIFLLVAKGYSSRQIGEVLNLSAKTVANNLSIIKQKLNVETTAAMAHLAMSHQLIEVHQPTGQPVQPSKLAS